MLGIPVLPAIVLFVGLSLFYTYIGGVKGGDLDGCCAIRMFLAGGLFTLG